MPRRFIQPLQRRQLLEQIRDGLTPRVVVHDPLTSLHPHAAPAPSPGEWPDDASRLVAALDGYAARCVALLVLGQLLLPAVDAVLDREPDAAARREFGELVNDTGWRIIAGEVEWRDVVALRERHTGRARDSAPIWRHVGGNETAFIAQRRRHAATLLGHGIAEMLATAAAPATNLAFTQVLWLAPEGTMARTIGRWWHRFAARFPLDHADRAQFADLTPPLLRALDEPDAAVVAAATAVLAHAPDAAAGPALLAVLQQQRRHATTALAALGAAGIEALPDWQPVIDLVLAGGEPHHVRVAAVQALAAVQHPHAIALFSQLASNARVLTDLRRAALRGLIAIDTPATTIVLRALASDALEVIAAPAAVALVNRKDADAPALVAKLLSRPRLNDGELFAALPRVADVSWIPELIEHLERHGRALHATLAALPRHLVVHAATRRLQTARERRPDALLRLLDELQATPVVCERLTAVLRDDGADRDDREKAAWSLGHIGTPVATRELQDAERVPDRRVRKLVARVRRTLGWRRPRGSRAVERNPHRPVRERGRR